ncbi:MAG: S1 RNA-binding domain-containing protein [Synechococcaceae cyanobacterium SM2_3_2]|nr:S1 RNA-binding domain-containing protein [Synechococcaceae cyanobacterium SM2_3_2]
MNISASRRAVDAFSMEDFARALDDHDPSFAVGQTITGRVVETAPEGAYVDIGGKSLAFVPLKEVDRRMVDNAAEIMPVGSDHEFLITHEEDREGQIKLSRRRQLLQKVWLDMKERLDTNQAFEVRVTGTNRGGVLVDAEGIRGFIPRSHLNHREELNGLVGQKLQVGVLDVNAEANKLVLSQKQVVQAASLGQFERGQVVEGKITGIKPFGVFVQIDDATGLLHIKQISESFIRSLEDLFQVGQSIKAVVLDIDEGRGRMALSTRVLEKHPGEMLEQMATVLSEAEERAGKIHGKLEEAAGN